MSLKKTLTILLLSFVCHTIVAQLEEGTYKGFKISDKNKDEAPQLMDIYVSDIPSGNLIRFSDNKKKPLEGCYHVVINPNKYVITNIQKGILEGEWTYWFYGKVSEKASFKQGKRDGETHEYYYGHDVWTYDNGKIMHHIAHHKNGQLKVEQLYDENGKLHGNIKEYREDGSLSKEENYQHGIPHGKFVETNEEGYTWIKNYKNGKLDGPDLEEFANGKTSQKGSYANGEKTGQWVDYEEPGVLRWEIDYLDGKLHGEKKTYSQGKLYSFEEYANGRRHGKWMVYDETSQQIREEKNYTDDQLDGYTKYYQEKGLYKEILYKKGEEVLMREYDQYSGNILIEYTYRDGNVIREKVYNNGKLKLLRLANEYGSLVDVQEYNTAGKVIKTNTDYKKSSSTKLTEDASGIIDIEIEDVL